MLMHNSPFTTRAFFRYRCRDGVCLDERDLCDGVVHCRDGSDEERCEETERCPSSEFPCRDGSSCVPQRFLCDGTLQVSSSDCHDICLAKL